MFQIVSYLCQKKRNMLGIQHSNSLFYAWEISAVRSAWSAWTSQSELLCAGRVGTSGISGHAEALAEQLQLPPLLHC